MIRKITLLVLSILAYTVVPAQQSNYTQLTFFDDFDDGSFENWKVTNNADNQYFLENGRYEMYRRNAKTADLVFCNWVNSFNDFEIRLTFTFDKNRNKKQYAGLVFKASNKLALLAELHEAGKVRIRKIVDGKVYYVTGNAKEEGWLNFKEIMKEDNLFTIQSDRNTYSVFINGVPILSESLEGFTPGRVGLVVGTNTKIRVDNFGVYTSRLPIDTLILTDSVLPVPRVVNPTEPRVAQDTVTQVKDEGSRPSKSASSATNKPNVKHADHSELDEMKKKNEALQLQLNQYRNKAYQAQDKVDSLQAILDYDGKKEYRKENQWLVAQNDILEKRNDSLLVLMRTYEDVRAILSKSEGGEISLKLAEKLRMEKLIGDELQKRNKELELQNKKLNLQLNKLESALKKLKSATPKKK